MGEWADQWAAEGRPNLWGTVPTVVEMQSEGGAAGAVHGALQTGALATTFTASQGLLLMIPNMYKIAGELTPTVFHVAARSLATQALSIFGDHTDVMAARATGLAMLASSSVQEAMDLALIAQAATLEARVPFLHFFDGFRTSHEVAKIEPARARRAARDDRRRPGPRPPRRALSPDHPVLRGTAQNPDVYFQARETVNPFYLACPTIVQSAMDQFAGLTGRRYHLFDYVGAPDAERVIVLMGSGRRDRPGDGGAPGRPRREGRRASRCGCTAPSPSEHFLAALPATAQTIAVLDRTKEPGSVGEPLYLDVVTALSEAVAPTRGVLPRPRASSAGATACRPRSSRRRWSRPSSTSWRRRRPQNHFTVGIDDDVTHTSLDYDPAFSTEPADVVRAVFYGLGSDGTVGANKNSIKIIGEETDHYAQGYFVYDSKKSGSVTVSHLRFGPRPIRSTYLISRATFVACHQFSFLERFDVLSRSPSRAPTFLLNSPYGRRRGLGPPAADRPGGRSSTRSCGSSSSTATRSRARRAWAGAINTVMQTCFFAISGVLPRDEAIAAIKHAIEKTYGKRGEAVVQKNFAAVDAALTQLCRGDGARRR